MKQSMITESHQIKEYGKTDNCTVPSCSMIGLIISRLTTEKLDEVLIISIPILILNQINDQRLSIQLKQAKVNKLKYKRKQNSPKRINRKEIIIYFYW